MIKVQIICVAAFLQSPIFAFCVPCICSAALSLCHLNTTPKILSPSLGAFLYHIHRTVKQQESSKKDKER